MPLPFLAPLLSAGAGSTIPITGGTAGPATSGNTGAPINIGGLFGGRTGSSSNELLIPLTILGAAALVAFLLLRRK